MNKDVKYLNDGNALSFDSVSGFAENPDGGNAFFAADFRNQILTIVGTGTIIVYGSCQQDPPDFSAASTIDNSFTSIVTADYSVQSIYYNGATGIVVSAETKIVELNTNMLTWFAIHRSANTVNVKATETNNQ